MEQEAEQVARRVAAPKSTRIETAGSWPGVSKKQEAWRYAWGVPSIAVQLTSTLLRAPHPGASAGPLYDTTRWRINPPVTGQTLANMKTAIAGRISKGDIASATVVGVPLGTNEEMYLLNIIYQLGTKGNWDRVMKVEAEVAPPVGSMGQHSRGSPSPAGPSLPTTTPARRSRASSAARGRTSQKAPSQ